MLDWIKMFLDPKGATQAPDPRDTEIERKEPKPPKSRYINESGKVVKGPGYKD